MLVFVRICNFVRAMVMSHTMMTVFARLLHILSCW